MHPDRQDLSQFTPDSLAPVRAELNKFKKTKTRRRNVIRAMAGLGFLGGGAVVLSRGFGPILREMENVATNERSPLFTDTSRPIAPREQAPPVRIREDGYGLTIDDQAYLDYLATNDLEADAGEVWYDVDVDLDKRPSLADLFDSDFWKKGAEKPKAILARPGRGRKLENEEEYLKYLAGIGLEFISPDDVVKPHRNILRGVKNRLPPQKYWENIEKTLVVADRLCGELGVPLKAINSAYRSPQYNAKCPGAAKNSYHTRNMALDMMFACSPKTVGRTAREMRSKGVFKGGVGIYSSFVHIDTRGHNASWGISV